MDDKGAKKVIKKIQIATEYAVKVTAKSITDELVIIEIVDKLMTEEHIAMLTQTVAEQLDRGAINIIVDLSKVKRINSSGLGSIISIYTSIRNRNGTMKIGGMNEFIKKVLEITKLIEVFEIYESADEAIESYNK